MIGTKRYAEIHAELEKMLAEQGTDEPRLRKKMQQVCKKPRRPITKADRQTIRVLTGIVEEFARAERPQRPSARSKK